MGTGWIAADHIFLLGKLGHEVVAVCDLDRARAEEAAPAGAAVYEDWHELLERETIDALWVTTPPLHHRGPAVAAMERGLPVFLEKPVARTIEDADAIVDAWRRTGRSARSAISGTRPKGSRRCGRSSPDSGSHCSGA